MKRENTAKALTPDQARALNLRASGLKVVDIAEKMGKLSPSVSRMLNREHVQARLRAIQERPLQGIEEELKTLCRHAVETLRNVMESGKNDPVRVKAALAVLDRTGFEAGCNKSVEESPSLEIFAQMFLKLNETQAEVQELREEVERLKDS